MPRESILDVTKLLRNFGQPFMPSVELYSTTVHLTIPVVLVRPNSESLMTLHMAGQKSLESRQAWPGDNCVCASWWSSLQSWAELLRAAAIQRGTSTAAISTHVTSIPYQVCRAGSTIGASQAAYKVTDKCCIHPFSPKTFFFRPAVTWTTFHSSRKELHGFKRTDCFSTTQVAVFRWLWRVSPLAASTQHAGGRERGGDLRSSRWCTRLKTVSIRCAL